MKDERHLSFAPCSLEEAQAFCEQHHRHARPPVGHKFSISAVRENRVVGVVTVGRPVARMLDDGWTLEVTRCTTDGTRNACSLLYRAAWRAVRAMGYRRLVTYTREGETGGSLKASGFEPTTLGKVGGSWDTVSRPRVNTNPRQATLRWEIFET